MKLYIILELMDKEGITRQNLADALGISPYTLRTRFRKETSFTVPEVKIIKKLLGLTIEQVDYIFFNNEVA